MMANNVIVFPKENRNIQKSISIDEINHNVEQMKLYHIQETITDLVPMIFNQLDVAGFGMDDDSMEDIKDGALIVESIRSLMCKYYGISHPFQTIAEHVFVENENEFNSYKIAKTLNIELKSDGTETN